MGHEETTNEMSQDEQALREEVFAEVFDMDGTDTIDDLNDSLTDYGQIEPAAEAKEEAATPNIPPDLQKQIEGMSNRLNALSAIEERLKQTERRIGSMQNEFHAAKIAATEQLNAPTASEMADAAKEKADWDELKEDYPEWADAIEKKLAATSAEVAKAIPKISDLKDGLVSTEVFEQRLLSFKYPDWKQTVKKPEYHEWLKAQPNELQHKHYNGKTADDAVFVLDRFNAFQATKKNPQQIAESRKTRLQQAAQKPTTQKAPSHPKSEADMSDDELRELEFAKIWG